MFMNECRMNVSIVQKRKINAKRVAYGHQTFNFLPLVSNDKNIRYRQQTIVLAISRNPAKKHLRSLQRPQ